MARAKETANTQDTRLDTFNRTLEVAPGPAPHVNQFVRRNPKLAAALAEREMQDRDHERADLQDVSNFLLGKIVDVALADPATLDEKKAAEVRSYLLAEEMHRAKVDKIKADIESTLANVATPTALRNLLQDYGMCILRANEETVLEMLTGTDVEREQDLIRETGMKIYQLTMDKIKAKGYEDGSLAKLLAAPR